MKLYMKQRVFSFTQDFDIYDENQQSVYNVRGEFLTFGRRLHVYDSRSNKEVAFIRQKLLTLMPKFEVFAYDSQIALIEKRFTFFKPKYEIKELGWSVKGDVFAHDYTLYDKNNRMIARIHKKFFSWSDTFEIAIVDSKVDPVYVVAIVLTIDAVMDAAQSRNNSSVATLS